MPKASATPSTSAESGGGGLVTPPTDPKSKFKAKENFALSKNIKELTEQRKQLKEEQKRITKTMKKAVKKNRRTWKNAKKMTNEELMQVILARGCGDQLPEKQSERGSTAKGTGGH